MFLKKILARNPELIEAGVLLHQQGKLPANCYVLDIDRISENARFMAEEGKKYGLKVFAMTKQIGRNPVAIKTMVKAGIGAGVCVDMNDAGPMKAAGMDIGHLGHLVQVPFAQMKAAAALDPMYWMVYSMEKAQAVSDTAADGKKQKLMLRITGEGDEFYKGHEAGFPIETMEEVIKRINELKGASFAGIATFPAQLYSADTGKIEHTHNYRTVLKAAERLQKAGCSRLELNAPGTTSGILFKGLSEDGVTQVEPGHGLTGTTPLHAYEDLEEMPAMIYVSEISHSYGGKPYCFGGGMYIDPVFPPYDVKACVGSQPEKARACLMSCDMPAPQSIDYYGILQPEPGQRAAVGDTVVFGFRAQAFVTRAYVAPVSGIASGRPRVEGIYTTDGRETRWPDW